MRNREGARTARERNRTRQSGRQWNKKKPNMLTTPDRANRSLTMLSLLAGCASLLRRQHLD